MLIKKTLFVRMCDIQFGLNIKSIPDFLRKEIQCIYEKIYPTKEQIKKYERSEAEIDTKNIHASNVTKYACYDVIEKMIKTYKYVKKCYDGINRIQKENQRQNFREMLQFNEKYIYTSKECSILSKITTIFSAEKIIL